MKVVSHKHLPMRPPTIPTIVAWLVADRLGAPGWVWGAGGACAALLWFAYFLLLYVQDPHEPKWDREV